MIKESIKLLDLIEKNRVLELGHGNCYHLNMLLKEADDLKYFGMEISEIMKEAAEKTNETSIRKRKALFQLYDGINIWYVSNFFDRILTVNTLYFIEKPLDFLNEMYRVLKPGGKCVLTFTKDSFMKNLPFVVNSKIFTLYNVETIKNLVSQTDFILSEIHKKKESIKSRTKEMINRPYFVIVLHKKEKEVVF